jgi:asparagine synthetase B (glutamine-hydrolysing)
MHIKPYSLHFFNKNTDTLQKDIWTELNEDLWSQLNINNYFTNSKIPSSQPQKTLPLFEHYTIIPPGTFYNKGTHQLKEDLYYPTYVETNKEKLYQVFEKYFAQYSNKKIAVHLSGGLDSSIIIGLLHHFNIPFYLVGLVSYRFEFRTEKAVQELLASLGKESILIDMEDYPSFGNLAQKPLSQIPDGNIKQVDAGRAVAKACKDLGTDVVFTGQGGDTIFVDAIPKFSDSWGCNIGNEFIQTYEAEVLYPNEGLELVSPYADKEIINAIYSLRIGQKNDCLKKWARHFFSDILIRELVEYTYCADFFGTSMDGLEKAKPETKLLFKSAFEITGDERFSPQETENFLAIDVFNFEYQNYIDFCDKLSLATWYNALLREGYVK